MPWSSCHISCPAMATARAVQWARLERNVISIHYVVKNGVMQRDCYRANGHRPSKRDTSNVRRNKQTHISNILDKSCVAETSQSVNVFRGRLD